MRTATVRQLRTEFPRLQRWLAAGETITITKRRKVVAELSLPRPKKKPDFAKRFGHAVAAAKTTRPRRTLRDLLEEDRGE